MRFASPATLVRDSCGVTQLAVSWRCVECRSLDMSSSDVCHRKPFIVVVTFPIPRRGCLVSRKCEDMSRKRICTEVVADGALRFWFAWPPFEVLFVALQDLEVQVHLWSIRTHRKTRSKSTQRVVVCQHSDRIDASESGLLGDCPAKSVQGVGCPQRCTKYIGFSGGFVRLGSQRSVQCCTQRRLMLITVWPCDTHGRPPIGSS